MPRLIGNNSIGDASKINKSGGTRVGNQKREKAAVGIRNMRFESRLKSKLGNFNTMRQAITSISALNKPPSNSKTAKKVGQLMTKLQKTLDKFETQHKKIGKLLKPMADIHDNIPKANSTLKIEALAKKLAGLGESLDQQTLFLEIFELADAVSDSLEKAKEKNKTEKADYFKQVSQDLKKLNVFGKLKSRFEHIEDLMDVQKTKLLFNEVSQRMDEISNVLRGRGGK